MEDKARDGQEEEQNKKGDSGSAQLPGPPEASLSTDQLASPSSDVPRSLVLHTLGELLTHGVPCLSLSYRLGVSQRQGSGLVHVEGAQ